MSVLEKCKHIIHKLMWMWLISLVVGLNLSWRYHQRILVRQGKPKQLLYDLTGFGYTRARQSIDPAWTSPSPLWSG